jgi:hypothetical protein
MIWVELKLESKDLLLARIWHSIELLLFTLACWESAIYGHVDGSVLLGFSWLNFACGSYLCVEISEFCDYCGKFVWPNCEPEDWEVTWEPAPWAATEDFPS